MGWEWRVFNKVPLDVCGLLHLQLSLPNIRTDSYVLCTDSVSIKFRHGDYLEFKIRERRHESGAELWKKVEYHGISLRKNLNIKVLQSLVADKLESVATGYDQDVQVLLTQAAKYVRDNWKLIEIHKNRRNSHHAGVHVEQTNISLTGKDDQWQTICFEGSLENILKFLASTHGKQITEYCNHARGYPEFLCTIE